MSKTTSFNLGNHFEGFLATQVKSGRYHNVSEVIRAALREMEDRLRREAIAEMMHRSMENIDAGQTRPAKKALQDVANELGLDIDR